MQNLRFLNCHSGYRLGIGCGTTDPAILAKETLKMLRTGWRSACVMDNI